MTQYSASNPPITNPDYDLVHTIYPFSARNISGAAVKLEKYRGNICLFVNVTSKSDYADWSYLMLNSLYEKFGESEGLKILAFPCNQFNDEEPGSDYEIKKFAKSKGVKFDMFSKINVNCDDQHQLWKFLKETIKKNMAGEKCNKVDPRSSCVGFCNCNYKLCVITEPFTKFLVNREGVPVQRFGPEIQEREIIDAMEPYFTSEKYRIRQGEKRVAKVKPIELPPPLKEDNRPCKKSWYFTPGHLYRL